MKAFVKKVYILIGVLFLSMPLYPRDTIVFSTHVIEGTMVHAITEKARVYAETLTELDDNERLVSFLTYGRVDIIIGNSMTIEPLIKGSEIITLEPPLLSLPIYAYMHKSKSSLASLVAEAMYQMKTDGTYERILDSLKEE